MKSLSWRLCPKWNVSPILWPGQRNCLLSSEYDMSRAVRCYFWAALVVVRHMQQIQQQRWESSTIDDEWMWNYVTLLWSEPHGYNSLPSSPSCIATFGSPLVGPLRRYLLLWSNDKEWSRAIVYLELIYNCAKLLLIASWVYRFLVGWSWQHDQLDLRCLQYEMHISIQARGTRIVVAIKVS